MRIALLRNTREKQATFRVLLAFFQTFDRFMIGDSMFAHKQIDKMLVRPL